MFKTLRKWTGVCVNLLNIVTSKPHQNNDCCYVRKPTGKYTDPLANVQSSHINVIMQRVMGGYMQSPTKSQNWEVVDCTEMVLVRSRRIYFYFGIFFHMHIPFLMYSQYETLCIGDLMVKHEYVGVSVSEPHTSESICRFFI